MQESNAAVEQAQERVAHLLKRLGESGEPVSGDVAVDALTEVEVALEELRVAEERLREQNTELLDAHAQLTAERERYARLFEEAPEAYFVTDADGIIREANDMAALLLGVRQKYVIGKPLINYVAMPDRLELRQSLIEFNGAAGDKGRRLVHVKIIPPIDRDPFEARLQFAPFRQSGRSDEHEVRWVMRDISDNTRRDREYYQLLIDVIEDYAILVMDINLRIVIWNRGAERLFGYSTGEAIGMDAQNLFPQHHVGQSPGLNERDRALEVGRADEEHWYIRKDGTRFYGSGVLISLPGSDPARRFVKILRDATLRKRSQESDQIVREDLENRVHERTIELAHANSALQREIVERQSAEDSRRDLLRGWVQSLEEERRRISRELHDEMGQHLTAFALGLGALEDSKVCDASTQPLLDNLRQMAQEMGREVHRLAVDLRPTALDDLGVIAALSSYVEAWSERTSIFAQFQVAGNERPHLNGEIETMLYRSAQEALNNILKHARATEVSVLLQVTADHVALIVEDNGRGFDSDSVAIRDADAQPGGLGLTGIQERVSLLGGTFSLESSIGCGTTLYVRAPMPEHKLIVRDLQQ